MYIYVKRKIEIVKGILYRDFSLTREANNLLHGFYILLENSIAFQWIIFLVLLRILVLP